MSRDRDILTRITAWLLGLGDIQNFLSDISPAWAKTLNQLRQYLSLRLGNSWWDDFVQWQDELQDE